MKGLKKMQSDMQRKIIEWGDDKGILWEGTVDSQFRKTVSEVGELADAINSGEIADIEDAMGDVYVTLVLTCELLGLSLDDCIEKAYNVISKRTGTMVNGAFVKDE